MLSYSRSCLPSAKHSDSFDGIWVLGLAGSYRVEDLEWYEIPMSCSQWETLRIILDAYDDDRQYDSSVP